MNELHSRVEAKINTSNKTLIFYDLELSKDGEIEQIGAYTSTGEHFSAFITTSVRINTSPNLKSKPQELIDLIIDQLHLMNRSDILAKWRAGPKCNPAEDTFYDLVSTPATRHSARPPRYLAERTVLSRMLQEHPGIRAIRITASRPGSKPNSEPLEHKTYLHLSAFKSANSKPSLAWNLPPSTSLASLATTGAVYIGTKGRVTAGLNPGHNTSQDFAIDATIYTRNSVDERRNPGRGSPEMQSARLLQCENVAEAIQGWDREAVKEYVEVLGLEVVPSDRNNGDRMRPGLHVWQKVADCVDA